MCSKLPNLEDNPRAKKWFYRILMVVWVFAWSLPSLSSSVDDILRIRQDGLLHPAQKAIVSTMLWLGTFLMPVLSVTMILASAMKLVHYKMVFRYDWIYRQVEKN